MESDHTFPRVCARIPTTYGDFDLCIYEEPEKNKEHLAFVRGDLRGKEAALIRVHSECFTGDVLGSLRCDCGEQLQRAIQMIAVEGTGMVIYLRQEGRGIGLVDKLRAYNLQDEGYDTVDANLALGHQADERDYSIAAKIIKSHDIRSVRMITNNPAKIKALNALGVKVTGQIPLVPSINHENLAYLRTKIIRMNHKLSLSSLNGNGANGHHK